MGVGVFLSFQHNLLDYDLSAFLELNLYMYSVICNYVIPLHKNVGKISYFSALELQGTDIFTFFKIFLHKNESHLGVTWPTLEQYTQPRSDMAHCGVIHIYLG